MKLQRVYIIEEVEQLKAVSDPFRTTILNHLIEKAYTGQQLAQLLELSRSKVHYHLNELERNGFIQVVKNEVKNGIIQKFYRAVAWSFVPADKLLPHRSEVESYFRENTLNTINRARLRTLSAPEEAFQVETSERDNWTRMAMQMEVRVKPERFAAWLTRYRRMAEELSEMEEEDGQLYYLATVGFQIDQPWFEEDTLDSDGGGGARTESLQKYQAPSESDN